MGGGEEGEKPAVLHSVPCNKPFIHTFLHAGVYKKKKESLVWLEAPDLCCTLDIGPSLGLFLDMLLLPCVVEIRQFPVNRPVNPCPTGWMLGCANS